MDLEGVSVKKNFGSKAYLGRVSFVGEQERPYAFLVTYEDGDQETMTREEVEKLVVPHAAQGTSKSAASRTRQQHHPVKGKVAKVRQTNARARPPHGTLTTIWADPIGPRSQRSQGEESFRQEGCPD